MSARLRVLMAAGGLLVVAAIVAAVVTGVRLWSLNAEEDARDSALAAARDYTVTMFGRDPKNVSEHINATMGFLTGGAREEFQKNVSDAQIAEIVKRDQIVTVATVEGAGVMENTRDSAKVLVYLNLSSTRNVDTEQVQIDQSRIIYDMVRRDGRWLIAAFDILDDDSISSRIERVDTPPSGAVPIPKPSGTP